MTRPARISITGTQTADDTPLETIKLETDGTYRYEPGYAEISYVESELTGFEGVVTTFAADGCNSVTLRRKGKVNAQMIFERGLTHDSLYDVGFGAIMLSVVTDDMTVLLNEHGGVLDLDYRIEAEHVPWSQNHYHIEVQTSEGGASV